MNNMRNIFRVSIYFITNAFTLEITCGVQIAGRSTLPYPDNEDTP